MNGVESSTTAEGMVRAIGAGNRLSPPAGVPQNADLARDNVCAKGFVSAMRERLTQTLTGAGFVHVGAGPFTNYGRLVGRGPDESRELQEDLMPGLAAELASWAAEQIASRPEAAGNAQAHVDPQRAVALLR
ncbi:MAG: hypothetical protein JW741_27030 [Sedimentisphaerales bacterium]|nr:hypothetical protein [Sedimentisphaerales bacterium]